MCGNIKTIRKENPVARETQDCDQTVHVQLHSRLSQGSAVVQTDKKKKEKENNTVKKYVQGERKLVAESNGS